MSSIEVKIGGVPEHFNYPWKYALKRKLFPTKLFQVVWKNFPGGTGAMCEDLRNGNLDMAVLLTEGAVANLANNGNDFKILQWYVRSPLVWGIHTGAKSIFKSLISIENKKIAISRFGSGSHLMPYLYAKKINNKLTNENFIQVNNLEGAINSLNETKETDLFFWEKFTTQPYVDKKIVKRLGTFSTPWPCFVLCVSNDFLDKNPLIVEKVQECLAISIKELLLLENLPARIARMYKLPISEVNQWLETIEWERNGTIDKEIIESVQKVLSDLQLINSVTK